MLLQNIHQTLLFFFSQLIEMSHLLPQWNLLESETNCAIFYIGQHRNTQVVILPTRGSLYLYIFFVRELKKLELKYKILKNLFGIIIFMSGQILK